MKDWKDCDKITYHRKTLIYEGKPYNMNYPIFKACYKCSIQKCRGKVLINAQNKVMNAISKI